MKIGRTDGAVRTIVVSVAHPPTRNAGPRARALKLFVRLAREVVVEVVVEVARDATGR